MTHLRYSLPKSGKHFLLEVVLQAGADGICRMEKRMTAEIPGRLQLGSEVWNAAQLLLAAVAAGWADSFLAFAARERLPFLGISCQVIGQLYPVKGAYRFTGIDLYPIIRLKNPDGAKLATRLLRKSEQQNPVAGTLDTALYYHSHILTGEADL